jgi:SAM-dependent methyltransferase
LPDSTIPQPPTMTADEAIAYWDERHGTVDHLRSGGNLGYDVASNEILYLVRLGRLAELVGFTADESHPLDVLDAGCGKGYFARGMAQCRHRVDAIDASEHAIEHCRQRGGGPRFVRSTLAEWRSPFGYDVVFSIDVLFHLTDEAEWQASVRNLASLVRLGGRFIFTDWKLDTERVFNRYQVSRPRESYKSLLDPLGLTYAGFTPDGFRDSGVGFHVFLRTH